MSPRARKLRDYIVNNGEDELVYLWQNLKTADGNYIFHEAMDVEFKPVEYQKSYWTDVENYQDILLKDILPSSLWCELRQGKEE
jgi:hypothetical protein